MCYARGGSRGRLPLTHSHSGVVPVEFTWKRLRDFLPALYVHVSSATTSWYLLHDPTIVTLPLRLFHCEERAEIYSACERHFPTYKTPPLSDGVLYLVDRVLYEIPWVSGNTPLEKLMSKHDRSLHWYMFKDMVRVWSFFEVRKGRTSLSLTHLLCQNRSFAQSRKKTRPLLL